MKKIALVATALAISVVGAYAESIKPMQTAQATAPAQTKTMSQMLASDVMKSDVYDMHDNKIGTIDDVLMARDGSPEQAIIGVGGFLGVGEKDVAVPFSELTIRTRNGKNWFELNRTKDQLKSAAAFDTKSHKMM